MSYLADILPALPEPDSTQPFPAQPSYYVFGLSADKQDRVTYACFDHEDIKRREAELICKGWNAYVAQASFADYLKGRKQSNVAALRSFFADIDVGKAKNAYATQEDAVAGIAHFVKETGLKPSYIVCSGVGFYVYWCLDQDIKPAAWKKLATWLTEIMRAKGLIFDPACTCDSARVLRLPHSYHQSNGARVEIVGQSGKTYSVQQFVAKLYDVAPPSWEGIPDSETAPAPDNVALSNPFGSPVAEPPKAYAEPVVNACRQVREAGFGTEPQWYAMMSVLRRCVDGREWAHKLSEKDDRYDYDDTERKFWHAPEDAPARCVTFEQLEPRLCEGCPHRGTIRSPIQLWRKQGETPVVSEPEAEPEPETERLVLPPKFDYPLVGLRTEEFEVGPQGIVWNELVKNKDTGQYDSVPHIITQSQLYYIRSVWNYDNGRSYRQHWFRVINPNGHTEDVYLPSEACASAQRLMEWFYGSNIFPAGQYGGKTFMAFMNAYLNAIMNNNNLVELPTSDKFGWRTVQGTDGKEDGFAVGLGIVTAEGMRDTQYTGVAARLAPAFDCKGTLENWKESVNMYSTLDQKAAQLGVCLSFAAPLMKYGSGVATSATYSLWSTESGLGKTQMLRAAASVWGNPDGQWVQRQASETARQRQLAVLNNLPAFMDELTDVSDEDLYSLAYSLVGGVEKNKLKRNGVEMASTGTWNTVTFCTSNKSIKEAVARKSGDSAASIVRVIEYECDFKSYADKPEVQDYIHDCMTKGALNYGLAGPNFVWQLLRHKGRLATLTPQIEFWATRNGFTSEERFMAYPLALALTAGRWAKEWGLLDYDMDELERWILDVFVPHNRRSTTVHSSKPKNIFLSYLSERQRNLLMVEHDKRDASEMKAPNLAVSDPYIRIMPDHADTLVRLAFAERTLYVAEYDLKRWCRRNNHSASNLIKELAAAGIESDLVNQDLSHGVSTITTPPVPCYRFLRNSFDRLGFDPEGPANKQTIKNLVEQGRMY